MECWWTVWLSLSTFEYISYY